MSEVWYENGIRKTTAEYRAWVSMRNRCYNVRGQDYRYYGGRGICVCHRWKLFENFLSDMGRRPTAQHTLDRKNVDGHYCKHNCRWATRQEQAQNRNYCAVNIESVAQIRRLYNDGTGDQNKLAKIFRISQATVSQILCGQTWKNAKGVIANRSQIYRNMRGDRNGHTKVSDAQVHEIIKLYKTGKFTQKYLGNQFGVTQATISKIVLGVRLCA